MNFLIQLLLPLNDNDGKQFPGAKYEKVKKVFIDKFGGVTIYRNTTAEGAWSDSTGEVCRDYVLIFEVITSKLDKMVAKIQGTA
ncbi:MAG: hypothetical protein H0V61_08020 [Chitinophagales bacterium]|nr:hypothetical protein [Chitinophagales bacterium]